MSFSVFPHLDMPLSCFFLLISMPYPHISQIHMLSFLQTSIFGMPFSTFNPISMPPAPTPEFLFPPCTPLLPALLQKTCLQVTYASTHPLPGLISLPATSHKTCLQVTYATTHPLLGPISLPATSHNTCLQVTCASKFNLCPLGRVPPCSA